MLIGNWIFREIGSERCLHEPLQSTGFVPKSVTHGNVTIRVYRNAEPTKAGGFTHVLA